jgi:hypothetical protein
MTTVSTKTIPIESGPEWSEVVVTIVATGGPAGAVPIQFAVLPRYQRPVTGDWTNPVADPGGGAGIGVVVDPVSVEAQYVVWAKVGNGDLETIVLVAGLIQRN